ncbi:MAG: hypothetical protein BWX45_01216 [Deltaproteobacteria bacterium ADurb.Bin002]|nr:MAG: hypothetical protein BWX45_01216 [Deltaproteobacteria bacterium ADurb.Bin002]
MALTPTTSSQTRTQERHKMHLPLSVSTAYRGCGATPMSRAIFCRTSDSGQRDRSNSMTSRRTLRTRSLLVSTIRPSSTP